MLYFTVTKTGFDWQKIETHVLILLLKIAAKIHTAVKSEMMHVHTCALWLSMILKWQKLKCINVLRLLLCFSFLDCIFPVHFVQRYFRHMKTDLLRQHFYVHDQNTKSCMLSFLQCRPKYLTSLITTLHNAVWSLGRWELIALNHNEFLENRFVATSYSSREISIALRCFVSPV